MPAGSVLVQPRKTRPFITERLWMGRKESNQTKKLKHLFLRLYFAAFQPKSKKFINQMITFQHMKVHNKKLRSVKRKYIVFPINLKTLNVCKHEKFLI